MKYIVSFLFLCSSTTLLGGVSIVSPAELYNELDSWQVIDARPRQAFLESHIPKSRWMNWKEWTEETPNFLNWFLGDPSKWGKALTETQELRSKLTQSGVTTGKRAMVVGSPNAFGEEGRIAWNLLYWGVEQVALLDGGFPGWKKQGLVTEKGKEDKITVPPFQIQIKESRRASKNQVLEASKRKARILFDVRTPEEQRGKKMAGQARGGRIPGARLVELNQLYEPDGKYVAEQKLRELAGAPFKGEAIAYCLGGVRSALFALIWEARTGEIVLNYDGSLWEWSADKSLPLDSGKI